MLEQVLKTIEVSKAEAEQASATSDLVQHLGTTKQFVMIAFDNE